MIFCLLMCTSLCFTLADHFFGVATFYIVLFKSKILRLNPEKYLYLNSILNYRIFVVHVSSTYGYFGSFF